MVKLIVNADDFGLSELTNKGIADCFTRGIVTSTTVIANSDAFKQAVSLAKKLKLNVGIHLNLTMCKPVIEDAEHIADENGLLSNSNIKKAASKKLDLTEVEKEFRAQIEKVIDAGITPTHLDGHKHIHIFPGIVDIVTQLAKEYNIHGIRLPLGKIANRKLMFSKQMIKAMIVNHYARKAKKKFMSNGLSCPDSFYGLLETGNLSTENLKKILAHVKEETTELMCHPGYFDKDANSKLKGERETELRALTDESVKELVKAKDIKLISYKDI